MNLPIGRTLGLRAIFGPKTLAGGHHIRYPHINGWITVYWYAGVDIICLPTYPFIYILKKKKNSHAHSSLSFLSPLPTANLSLYLFLVCLSHSLCLYLIYIFDNYFEFCQTNLFFFLASYSQIKGIF